MFGLSTKGDYGLSFLEALVQRPKRLISLKEISRQKKLPLKYIERLAATLKRANIIVSKEGAGGGYILARPAYQIKLVEVLTILEGDLAPTKCTSDRANCIREKLCLMKQGWCAIHHKIYSILDSYSLADLYKKSNLTTNP
ncbi:MAG: Rrf2 family transcriptional regulator [Patescibacteria group bacterium]